MKQINQKQLLSALDAQETTFYYDLPKTFAAFNATFDHLPFSIRLLIEMTVRHLGEHHVSEEDLLRLINWQPQGNQAVFKFFPARVLLQDLSGVPVLNDLAGLRAALVRNGADPAKATSKIPVDLVIDHSLHVDFCASADAMQKNVDLEYKRNHERYAFLRWCEQNFENLKIIPPSSGIIHQVNLEHLAQVLCSSTMDGKTLLHPDSVVGTDSHTTMINALNVLGFGIGGIEAIAAMLGYPIEIPIPDVIGVKLTGRLRDGVSATDLALNITHQLRKFGVVNKFVEFCGDGLQSLSLADRAVVSNMAPEYGATIAYFPVDDQTLHFLQFTNRAPSLLAAIKSYYQKQALIPQPDAALPEFTQLITINLDEILTGIAGPKRPQDFIPLHQVKASFLADNPPEAQHLIAAESASPVSNRQMAIKHGSVVLAAITSCTNTSNPALLLAAGLLARNATQRGLSVPGYVRTSFTPGSKAVTNYMRAAGLMPALEKLGFHIAGYGCATCIGNSGNLDAAVIETIQNQNLNVCAVLSGNRNFEGRVNPHTRANYLASPMLVIAYALAGRIDIDFEHEPIGFDDQGKAVFLKEILPVQIEIQQLCAQVVTAKTYSDAYAQINQNSVWQKLSFPQDSSYQWNPASTYLQEPPFFTGNNLGLPASSTQFRVLALFGDSITTDHISPAGAIPETTPAGQWLISQGVNKADFNSYGARRGNDRVLTRATLANIRIKNQLVPHKEGGFTIHFPSGETLSIFDAAMRYKQENTPLLIIAGKEYGTGSSRDWAAKGVQQLGVKAILAQSFERIHRSNLACMGVLPIQFLPNENANTLHLTGFEQFSFANLEQAIANQQPLQIIAKQGEKNITFQGIIRLDSENEVEYYKQGGILLKVLGQLS